MAEAPAAVQAEIAQAIQKARYNETVQVTIASITDGHDDDANQPTRVCLAPSLDEQNGGIQWNPLADDDKIVSVRHLQTKRWMFPMLNDHRRNELYERAIVQSTAQLVEQLLRERTADTDTTTASTTPRTVHILDIGSGTGLLAMMAARALTKHLAAKNLLADYDIKVTSIEMAAAMAALAQETTPPTIQVQQGHSCSIPPLMPPADFCISELLESGLLGEGIVPALRDAWERHLRQQAPDKKDHDDGAIMVPQGARVYAQLVQGAWLSDYYGPHHAKDTTVAANSFVLSMDQQGSLLLDSSAVRLEVHAQHLLGDASLLEPLTAPTQVLELDFRRGDIPDESGGRQTVASTVTASGTVNGILWWWELDLCDGITYSTQPGKEPWQDHWHQCLQVLPTVDDHDVATLVAGQSVTLQVTHNDSRLAITLLNSAEEQEQEPTAQRQRSDNTAASLLSPDRCFQLNDSARTALLQKGIDYALQVKGKDAAVLDLSDFSFCAGLAAVAGATNVSSLESSSGQLPLTSAYVAQVGNNLPLSGARFDILQCHAEDLSLELLGGTAADIVVAEPYFEVLEGWHLPEALNYYYLIRALRARRVVSPTACVVPSRCRIMGCAIESEQLRMAYKACGDDNVEDGRIRGFDHGIVSKYGARFHEFDLSLPMWQYSYRRLSPTFELAALSFTEPLENAIATVSRTRFERAGFCDAILMWLQYELDFGSEMAPGELSTDDRSHRQIVRMLKEPVSIPPRQVENASLVCKCIIGGLDRPDDHQFELHIEK
jgi:SAM-dependent methyltransferase